MIVSAVRSYSRLYSRYGSGRNLVRDGIDHGRDHIARIWAIGRPRVPAKKPKKRNRNMRPQLFAANRSIEVYAHDFVFDGCGD